MIFHAIDSDETGNVWGVSMNDSFVAAGSQVGYTHLAHSSKDYPNLFFNYTSLEWGSLCMGHNFAVGSTQVEKSKGSCASRYPFPLPNLHISLSPMLTYSIKSSS